MSDMTPSPPAPLPQRGEGGDELSSCPRPLWGRGRSRRAGPGEGVQVSPYWAGLNSIARAAEKAKYHPDIDIRYNVVAITLSTHSARGVTEKDFALAQLIDAIASNLR